MRALHPEAFLLELAEQEAQQGVVALLGGGDDGWQRLQGAQVGLELGEVRALHPAGQANAVAPGLAQRADHAAELGKARVRPRIGGHGPVGDAVQADDEEGPLGRRAGLGQLDGQAAAAGDQAEARHRLRPRGSAGRGAGWRRRG
jgi:hypothetical protein